jgi:hypothetical protein
MIVAFFLSLFFGFINLLLGVLPTGHLPVQMTAAFAYFFGAANLFSYIVPVATLMQALVVVLVFDGAIMLWHFVNWIIRKIPGMQ